MEERIWQMEIAHQPTVAKRSCSFLGSPLAFSHGEKSSQSYLALGWMPLWVELRWEGLVKTPLSTGHPFLVHSSCVFECKDVPGDCCQFSLMMSMMMGNF